MPTPAQRLIHAVRTGSYDRIRELIERDGSVQSQSVAGRTALHAAAEEGDLKAAQMLIESGSDINARMKCGRTALHLAASYGGSCDLMDLDKDRADPCRRDRHHPVNRMVAEAIAEILKEGNTRIPADLLPDATIPSANKGDVFIAVMEAFSKPMELFQKLVERGIDVDTADPHFAEFLRGRPRYLRVVQFLLEQGADVNATDESGETPLHGAVESGRPEMVELLLGRGASASPSGSDESSATLIDVALEYSNVEVAEILLRHGTKFDFNTTYHLYEAAANGRLGVLQWLCEHGADVNRPREGGATALLHAASNGHHPIVEWLVEHQADVRVHDETGDGVMHGAANWPKCLEIILPLGLPVNQPNASGRTPFHRAAQCGNVVTIQELVQAGASVSAQDHEGNTPLHCIFFSEEFRPDVEFPVFHALVAVGADRSVKNHEGKTPFDLATQWHYPAEYLELLQPGPSKQRSAESFIYLGNEPYRDFLPSAIINVKIEGQIWPSGEHYFHAQKTKNEELREKIRQTIAPNDAGGLLNDAGVKRPAIWPQQCDKLMRFVLQQKFEQHEALRERLLATGSTTLVSDSNCEWYWVERPGVEFNTIGKMIMSIRDEMRNTANVPN